MSGSYADLSLSELSLNDLPRAGPSKQPFSLLARPSEANTHQTQQSQESEESYVQDEERILEGDDVQNDGDIGEEEQMGEEIEQDAGNETIRESGRRSAAFDREERLRQDLFVLQKLNAAFAQYNDALGDVQSGNERVSEQLKQTNALLEKYVSLLARSEKTTKLIFDERWWGADQDEATLAAIQREAEEKARREAEERARAEQAERERREREEAEQREREVREQAEAARREKLAARAGYGGVRGVRGTRASRASAMRTRGAATGTGVGAARVSPGATSARGRSVSATSSTAGGTTTGGRYTRPESSASVRSRASSRASVR